MKVAIGCRGAYRHITGVPKPPEPGEKDYHEWEERDLIVFSWIVDNIETDIVVDFAHHQSAKAIWESLSVTFESIADPYLVYDLEEKANKITQGELNLETYYRHLHGLWIEIDRCQTRPIDCCDKGLGQFRKHTATRRLFKFLAGLNEKYAGIRRDVLKEDPLPSVEAAYGWIKREATRLKIMPATNPNPTSATNADSSSGGIGGVGFGFGARNQRPFPQPAQQRLGQQQSRPGQQQSRPAAAYRREGSKPDKSKLWCSHCGMHKHTRETCFQLVGFPEWWEENQKAKAKMVVGVENNGGGHFSQTNDREISGSRGRGVEGDNSSSGGGNRRAEIGEIGEAAFAGKKEGAPFGGKGLGASNPSPYINILQNSPSTIKSFQKKPHVLPADPLSSIYLQKEPHIGNMLQIKPPEKLI